MKNSIRSILKLSLVAALAILTSVTAKADCRRVLLRDKLILTPEQKVGFPETIFSDDPSVQADLGVLFKSTDEDHTFVDPFGETHHGGGAMRFDIYKDGKVIASTRVLLKEDVNTSSFGLLQQDVVDLLTAQGCH